MMNQHLYKPLHTPYNNMKIYHFGLSEFCPKKGKYSKISTHLYIYICLVQKESKKIFDYPRFWVYWKALSVFSEQMLLQPHKTAKGCNWLRIAWNATFFVFRWKSFFEQKLLSIATNLHILSITIWKKCND